MSLEPVFMLFSRTLDKVTMLSLCNRKFNNEEKQYEFYGGDISYLRKNTKSMNRFSLKKVHWQSSNLRWIISRGARV